MLTKKEMKKYCQLYSLNEKEFKSIDYTVLNLDILNKVLAKSIYRNCNMMTKEGYVLINKITDEEYLNLRYFDIGNLFVDNSNLTLYEYKTKKIIEDMIIPRIYIKYAETYTEEIYNNMLERLYNN